MPLGCTNVMDRCGRQSTTFGISSFIPPRLQELLSCWQDCTGSICNSWIISLTLSIASFFVCVHVWCACGMCVCVHICMHACRRPRLWWESSSVTVDLIHWGRASRLNPALTDMNSLATWLALTTTCPALLCAGITGVLTNSPSTKHPHSGPQTYTPSMSPTESSTQHQEFILMSQ